VRLRPERPFHVDPAFPYRIHERWPYPPRDGEGVPARRDPCEILNEPDLALGDMVLVWVSPDERLKVVLGRVGPRQPTEDPAARGAPEELVLSATKRLVLRCGDGEIILRGDGRVVIRGTELVSKAKGANRIKGGHVVIN